MGGWTAGIFYGMLVDDRPQLKLRAGLGRGSHKGSYGTARHGDGPRAVTGGRGALVIVVSGGWQIEGLPAMVLRAGPQAAERTVEFVTAQIRNPHTRRRTARP